MRLLLYSSAKDELKLLLIHVHYQTKYQLNYQKSNYSGTASYGQGNTATLSLQPLYFGLKGTVSLLS